VTLRRFGREGDVRKSEILVRNWLGSQTMCFAQQIINTILIELT
jgi:hypothetical protein